MVLVGLADLADLVVLVGLADLADLVVLVVLVVLADLADLVVLVVPVVLVPSPCQECLVRKARTFVWPVVLSLWNPDAVAGTISSLTAATTAKPPQPS